MASVAVEVNPPARGEIDDNFGYMQRVHGEDAALECLFPLTDAIASLDGKPQRCATVEFVPNGVRRLLHRNHAACSRVEDPTVVVLRVPCASRDHEAELAALR